MVTKNSFIIFLLMLPPSLMAQYDGGSGDGFDRSSTPPLHIDGTIPADFTSGGSGDGFDKLSITPQLIDGTNPASFTAGGTGDGFDRLSSGQAYVDGTDQTAFASGGEGDGFDRLSSGAIYIDGTDQTVFTSGGTGDGFDRLSSGQAYVDGTNQASFVSGGSGDGFDLLSSGSTYIDGTDQTTFTSGGTGDGFDLLSSGSLYIDGTNAVVFTSGGKGDGLAFSLASSFLDGTGQAGFTSGGKGDGTTTSIFNGSFLNGSNQTAFTSGGKGDGFQYSITSSSYLDGNDQAGFTSGGRGDGVASSVFSSFFLDGSDQTAFTTGGRADGFSTIALLSNYLDGTNPHLPFGGGRGDGSDQLANNSIYLGGSSVSFLYSGGAGDGFEAQLTRDSYMDGTPSAIVFSGSSADGFAFEANHTLQLDGTHQPGAGMALLFDGTNRSVQVAHNAQLDLTDGTIEMWFRPDWTAGSNGYNPVLIAKDNMAMSRFAISISDDLDQISMFDGFTTSSISYSFTTGKWYHMALVESGGIATFYINGVFAGTTTNGFSSQSGDPLRIGASGSGNYFNGAIDEVRLWSASLDQITLQNWMCRKLTSSHFYYASMVGCWRFDEGSGTLTKDWSGTNTGMLINNPSWIVSGAPIGDEVLVDFSLPSSLSFAVQDAGQLSVQINSGTADGIVLYYVGESPSITNLPTGYNNLDQKYFGVFMTGSSPVYTVTYDYSTNISVNDENQIQLAFRDTNADNWADLGGAIDTNQNTILKSGLSGTEFILGGMAEAALPILLLDFIAESNGPGSVLLWWKTAQEYNSAHYEVHSSPSSQNFHSIGQVQAKGNSNISNEYYLIDQSPSPGINYYLLRQVDRDGNYEDSRVITYYYEPIDRIMLYPNPVRNKLWISLTQLTEDIPRFYLKDIQGKTVKTYSPNTIANDGIYRIDLYNQQPGLYFLLIETAEGSYNKKVWIN